MSLLSSLSFAAHLRSLDKSGRRVALLSLDPGITRSGFAVCENVFSRGSPRVTVGAGFVACPPQRFPTQQSRFELFTYVIDRLVQRHGACGLVVGWPLDPGGGRGGPECVFAEALATALCSNSELLRGKVLLWDERGSTAAARGFLREARARERGVRLGGGVHLASTNIASASRGRLPREVAGRVVDEASAVFILNSFLECEDKSIRGSGGTFA